MPNRPIGNSPRPPLPPLPDGRPAPQLRPRPGVENLRRAAGYDLPSRPANPGPDHPRQGLVSRAATPAPASREGSRSPGEDRPASPAAPIPGSPAPSSLDRYSLTQSPNPFFFGDGSPSFPPTRSASPASSDGGAPYVHPGEGDHQTARLHSPPPPPLRSPVGSQETLSTLPSLGDSTGSLPTPGPGTPTGGNYTNESRNFRTAWITERNLAGMTEPPRILHPGSRTPTPPSSPDRFAFPDLAGEN